MLTRRSKVGIVGAGFVGTALAYACQIKGAAREIALFDINRAKVEAEALDLAHGIQFTPQLQSLDPMMWKCSATPTSS